MLQTFRDRLTGPAVWFIVGIIVVPFAFFGIDQFVTGGGDPTVAKVGGQKITQSQWRQGFEQRLAQMRALMGESFRPEQFNNDRFRQAVLHDMVEEARLRQFVADAGYRASDAALFAYIERIPAFQEDGRFSTERYRSLLINRGYTPERFEAELRASIVVDQLRDGVLSSSFVTDPVLREAYRLARQQRGLAYASFKPETYLGKVEVTEEQVRERYEQNASAYLAPERLRVAYVELDAAQLPPAAAPAADVLRVIYEAEKAARFSVPEERLTRHILIPFGADKDKARQQAESLAEKIRKGADFAKLATAESEDPGSREKGGSLGWVRRGQMLESFEQALFGLGEGKVSDPVETEFGWHVIQVDDIRESRTQAFADAKVQAELLRIYQERERQKRFEEMAERLEQLAFESPNSLEPVQSELELPVKTSDWLSRSGGSGLFAEREVIEAAFSEEVLENDENSRPIALGEQRLVVLRKQEYEAPRQRPLEEVADQIRNELRQQAAQTRARADAEAALSAARAGEALQHVARQYGAAFSAPGLVRRDQSGLQSALLDALFALPRPEGEGASFGRVVLEGGAIAVLALTSVQDPEWPASDKAILAQERAALREALAGAEFAGYRGQIEDEIASRITAPAIDDTAVDSDALTE